MLYIWTQKSRRSVVEKVDHSCTSVVASCRFDRLCRVHGWLGLFALTPLVVGFLPPLYNYVVGRSCIDVCTCRPGYRTQFLQILPPTFRAGVCRPCVETELTATKKSATDGN